MELSRFVGLVPMFNACPDDDEQKFIMETLEKRFEAAGGHMAQGSPLAPKNDPTWESPLVVLPRGHTELLKAKTAASTICESLQA